MEITTKQTLLTTKQQKAYVVMMALMGSIGNHPDSVKEGFTGYFMTLDNIKELNGSLIPEDYFKDEKSVAESVSLSDLLEEDQKQVTEVLTNLQQEARSQEDLEKKCCACFRLAGALANRVLGIE